MGTSFQALATPAIGCSERVENSGSESEAAETNLCRFNTPSLDAGRSAKPFPRTVSLLPRRVQHPLLRLRINELRRHSAEPTGGDLNIANPPPQLSDEIRQHRPLIASDAIEAGERFLELPRCFTSEEALGLGIAFVDAAPSCSQQKIRHVSRLGALPLSHLRGGLVFVGARERPDADARRQFTPYPLLQHRRHLGILGEIAIGTRVSAPIAGVNEVRQRLRSSSAFVEVGSLSSERVCRDHRLRTKACFADGALQLDLL